MFKLRRILYQHSETMESLENFTKQALFEAKVKAKII
jgi:hypothetical protein